MAAITPRRSSRTLHTHTPKMSERKKGLFIGESDSSKDSLTQHRRLPIVESESDSEDCDLGIISTLDSSSSDENDQAIPRTPESSKWHETRSQTKKLLKETQDLKCFLRSPFTLNKYQTRYSNTESKTGSLSTPVTPHIHNNPVTPSSSHSCASAHTTSSTSSKARKSLASLIADTESCSSSLKDLNFDSDSGRDSKENTPTKTTRRSVRKLKVTPKFQSFKGILMEQRKNASPITAAATPTRNAVVCLTKMDMTCVLSPTQMLKTPHNGIESSLSPPKIGHNRRSAVHINESPESSCDGEKTSKRHRNDSISELAPIAKHAKMDVASKARLSLFNSDRLKEILSTKSFYGKSNPEINANVTTKISNAIENANKSHRRSLSFSHPHKQKRKPGQINSGVRHRIKKPKINKNKLMMPNSYINKPVNSSKLNSTASSLTTNDTSMLSQNSSQNFDEKNDPFDNEKQTIESLLSQWTEEEIPEKELTFCKRQTEIPCFNNSVIEETNSLFQPLTAVPVPLAQAPQNSGAVIVELGANNNEAGRTLHLANNVVTVQTFDQDIVMMADTEKHRSEHGDVPKSGQFLPVEGGYILVEENTDNVPGNEELPDLDEIERELKMLDEQILRMAASNNIDANAVLASTETAATDLKENDPVTQKMFSIFEKPNPGSNGTPNSKGTAEKNNKRSMIKTGGDQYIIDAGQKRFGATQCSECGVIYQIGDPQDEHDHLIHHNASDVLKFNGWKEECVVGQWETARCLRVRGGETGWRRVRTLLERVVNPQLGHARPLPEQAKGLTAYLYVDKKQIMGCLIVEPKLRANRLLPGDPDCCSVEDYPVKCGVSRLWSHANQRRNGIASRMLDCARVSYLYGQALKHSELAFSAPTQLGKAFAAKYCGTDNFYVYLD